MTEPKLPIQPYLITISENPAFTGKRNESARVLRPQVIDGCGIFLLADKINEQGDYSAVAASMWNINASRVAEMIASLDEAEIIIEFVRHRLAMKKLLHKKAISGIMETLGNMSEGFPNIASMGDFFDEDNSLSELLNSFGNLDD